MDKLGYVLSRFGGRQSRNGDWFFKPEMLTKVDHLILSTNCSTSTHSGCSTMEVNLAPITPLLHAGKLALPMVGTQATGLYTLSLASTTWQDKWKQYPHKHLLLPVDTMKAKLMRMCDEYISKHWSPASLTLHCPISPPAEPRCLPVVLFSWTCNNKRVHWLARWSFAKTCSFFLFFCYCTCKRPVATPWFHLWKWDRHFLSREPYWSKKYMN
jgi:hypothetical protein